MESPGAPGNSLTLVAGGAGFRYEIARKYGLHIGVDVASAGYLRYLRAIRQPLGCGRDAGPVTGGKIFEFSSSHLSLKRLFGCFPAWPRRPLPDVEIKVIFTKYPESQFLNINRPEK